MLHEILLALLGLLFVYLIPGFLVTYALFPRRGEMDREYDVVYRLGLGVVLSVAVIALLGWGLNAFPEDPVTGMGAIQAGNLWAGTLALTALFFALGWFRGAFPWLARLHPALARPLPKEPQALLEDVELSVHDRAKFRDLAEQRDALWRELRDYDRRIRNVAGDLRDHYRAKRAVVQERLQAVDAQLRALEEARAAEVY